MSKTFGDLELRSLFEQIWRENTNVAGDTKISHIFQIADCAFSIEGSDSPEIRELLRDLKHALYSCPNDFLAERAVTGFFIDTDANSTGISLLRNLEGCTTQNHQIRECDPNSSIAVGIEAGGLIVSLYDHKENRAIILSPLRQSLKDRTYFAAPFRFLFEEFHRNTGLQLLHAGAVCLDDVAALVIGPSGQGKSTTTAACAMQGLTFLGDDYIILKNKEDRTVVYPLYKSIKSKLNLNDSGSLLSFYPSQPSQEKMIYFLNQSEHLAIQGKPSVKAIILPIVRTAEDVGLIPSDKFTILKYFMPTSLLQSHHSHHTRANLIAKLIQNTPCYLLTVNYDFAEIGRVITSLCKTISR